MPVDMSVPRSISSTRFLLIATAARVEDMLLSVVACDVWNRGGDEGGGRTGSSISPGVEVPCVIYTVTYGGPVHYGIVELQLRYTHHG